MSASDYPGHHLHIIEPQLGVPVILLYSPDLAQTSSRQSDQPFYLVGIQACGYIASFYSHNYAALFCAIKSPILTWTSFIHLIQYTSEMWLDSAVSLCFPACVFFSNRVTCRGDWYPMLLMITCITLQLLCKSSSNCKIAWCTVWLTASWLPFGANLHISFCLSLSVILIVGLCFSCDYSFFQKLSLSLSLLYTCFWLLLN